MNALFSCYFILTLFSSTSNPYYPTHTYADPKIYKTGSSASILSEISLKSENSLQRYQKTENMSDSSLGDSLFSYQSNRRYFGSSESCRFGYECRRCSLDGDKCSFSDNCRYGDRCRNCDCSSSYFSSDFDDTTNFSRRSSTRYSTNSYRDNKYYEQRTTRYAEDFIKHVNNVKHNQMAQQEDNNQQTKNIQQLYGGVNGGHKNPHQQKRGIGSTSTVEYSSSSDTAMLGSNTSNSHKTRARKIQNEGDTVKYKSNELSTNENVEKKYATINNPDSDAIGGGGGSLKKTPNDSISKESTSTLKRRRNKTTGTIPKMNTFDSTRAQSTVSRKDKSDLNLAQYKDNEFGSNGKLKRYQSDDIDSKFQTIEQLDRKVQDLFVSDDMPINNHNSNSKNKTRKNTGNDNDDSITKNNSGLKSITADERTSKSGSGGGNGGSNGENADDDEVFLTNKIYETPKTRRVSNEKKIILSYSQFLIFILVLKLKGTANCVFKHFIALEKKIYISFILF